MFSDTKNGVVDFGESFDKIKKKTVRGLLKKRAKQYDSDSDDDAPKGRPDKKKKVVQKSSFKAAFNQVLDKPDPVSQLLKTKKFEEDKQVTNEDEPILSKYKKPSKAVEQDNMKEEELRLAR